MKKFVSRILSLGLALTAATAAAEADMPAETTKALSVGSVTVYDFGDIKLHAYNMGDALADECYLLESDEGLVMLETGAFTDQLNAWKGYIDGLDKPLAGALLAYHPNGIEVFGDIPVYATEKALSNWGKGGSIRGLTDGFVATFGDGVAANLPTKANLIKTGDKVTLALFVRRVTTPTAWRFRRSTAYTFTCWAPSATTFSPAASTCWPLRRSCAVFSTRWC